MADVRFEAATRVYPGSEVAAVDALDLQIADGEFMVLVGPSGSGKTTALRMLAGLEEVDAGAIYIGDRDVTFDPPKRRDISMVFQNYALYPYLTVAANIGFPLKIAGVRKADRERRVAEVAAMLELTELLELGLREDVTVDFHEHLLENFGPKRRGEDECDQEGGRRQMLSHVVVLSNADPVF